MATLAVAIGVAFLLISAGLWLAPAGAEIIARGQARLQTQPITLTLSVRLLGLGVSTLHLMVLPWGLWTMRTLFGRLAAGEAFETQTGVLLRRFGTAVLVYAGLIPIVACVTVYLITMYNPPGEHLFIFGIGDHEVILALIGTLILVLGSVLAEAARIADENRQIV
jgi:hypothetical protein